MPGERGPKLVGSSASTSASIPADKLGTPGAHSTLHIVPQFKHARNSDVGILTDCTRRRFLVATSLSKVPPNVGQTGHIKGDFSEKDGDCYLTMPPGAQRLEIGTPSGRVDIKMNDAGELSLVEFQCLAVGPQDARTRFIEVVYPVLDHLSYAHNVALFAAMIRIVDCSHDSIHIDYVGLIDNSWSRTP